jgi:hypothetical protein
MQGDDRIERRLAMETGPATDIQKIKGFNYAPGYAYTGADIWRCFDTDTFRRELGWGKKHFPRMSGIRLWLAWEVFGLGSDAEKELFLDNVDRALAIAENLDLVVMLVLFNRWHSGSPDWGGVYLDHLLPKAGWAGQGFKERCREYVREMMKRFGSDERVFTWDLCNEPFTYSHVDKPDPSWNLEKYETEWLYDVYADAKSEGPKAPLSVGFWRGIDHLREHEEVSDILNFHHYWPGGDADADEWRARLDQCVDLREKTGKPLFCSELGWGSLDDAKRVEILKFNLKELNLRNIGWFIHALAHSRIADLHRPEAGPVRGPGAMHCIEPDGSIRPGHKVINDYL